MLSTTSLIIDIQGFVIDKKKFIPKELAAYNGKEISHYIFKAPFSFDMLSPSLQKTAIWLMENHHCLNWKETGTPLHHFEKIIKNICDKADIIYVKGTEKAKYIRNFTNKPVIELNEQPALQKSKPKCLYHLSDLCMCALSNVYYLFDNFF